jgi:hypothetical protein
MAPKFLADPVWYGHLLAATLGAMIAGFIPAAIFERWTLNTGLDTIGFPIPLVAIILGYFLARKYPCKSAVWVWIPPLLYFVWNAHELAASWNPSWSSKTRGQYVFDSLLGATSACSSSECLRELFVTMPLASSLGYAVGVAISRIRSYKVEVLS